MGKKLLSLLLALVMVVMVLPVTALAADDDVVYVGESIKVTVPVTVTIGTWNTVVTCTPNDIEELTWEGNPVTDGKLDQIRAVGSKTQEYTFNVSFTTPGTYTITVTATSTILQQKKTGSKSITVSEKPCTHDNRTDTYPVVESNCKDIGCRIECWYCDDCETWFDANTDEVLSYQDDIYEAPRENSEKPADHEFFTNDEGMYECDRCHMTFVKEEVDGPCQHVDGDHQYGAPPTCTKTGLKERWQCSLCQKWTADHENWYEAGTKEFNDNIGVPAAEHTKELKSKFPQICTVDGYNEHYVCTTCGMVSLDGAEWHDKNKETDWYNSNIVIRLDGVSHAKRPGSYVEGNPATCQEDGNVEYWLCLGCGKPIDNDCNLLGETVDDTVIPGGAGKHTPDPDKHVEAVPGTCKEPAVLEHWVCSVCGSNVDKDGNWMQNIYGEKNPNNHVVQETGEPAYRDVKGQPQTCSKDGWNDYIYCDGCGLCSRDAKEWHEYDSSTKWYIDNILLKADDTSHVKTEDGHTHYVPATCQEDGNVEFWYCPDCGRNFDDNGIVDDVYIYAGAGHHIPDPEQHIEYVTGTCKDPEILEHWVCSVCGNNVDAEGNWMQNVNGEKAPGNHVNQATGEPYGHKDFGANAPTCEEPGNDAYWKCLGCNKFFDAETGEEKKKADFTIDPIGHDWHEGEVDAGGVSYEICANCGKFRVGGEDGTIIEGIPSMHTLDFVQGYPATCTEAGEMDRWVCTDKDCGLMFADLNANTILKDYVIPATNHKGTLVKVTHVPNCWYCTACGLYFSDAEGKTPMDQPADRENHVLVHYTEQDPNCQTGDGHEEYWKCVACGDLYADKDGATMTSLNKVQIPYRANSPEHHHLTKVPASTEHVAYRECQDCHMCFDDNGNVLDPSEVGKTENVGDHSLKFQPEVPATCTTDGVKAHWLCLASHNCGKYFADSLAKTPMTKADLEIPAGHKYIHFKGTEATMETAGRKGYDYCTVCGMVRLDGSESWITMDEAMQNWGIEKLPDTEVIAKPGRAATCTAPGEKAHWIVRNKITGEETYYLSELLKTPVSKSDLVIPMVDHQLFFVAESATTLAHYECINCHQWFETNENTKPDAPGGNEGDFVKPEPPKTPDNVIKDDMDLSGMHMSSILGKGNEP